MRSCVSAVEHMENFSTRSLPGLAVKPTEQQAISARAYGCAQEGDPSGVGYASRLEATSRTPITECGCAHDASKCTHN
jgi:hypothetical protein